MSDDNEENRVLTTGHQKQKDPNTKLREEFDKEWMPKLSEQRKKTMSAIRAANNEKKALAGILDDYEQEKADFNNAIREMN